MRRHSPADRRLSDLESGSRPHSTADSRLFELESGSYRDSTADSRLLEPESRSSQSMRARGWVLGALLACGRPPSASTPTPTEAPPTTAAPTTDATAPTPTSDAPTESWCGLEVFALEEGIPEGATLQSRLPSTPMLALATRSLSKSDCSSVGWHHLAFAPTKDDASGLVGAYLKRHLPVIARVPEAPYYLVGAKPETERAVDLKDVCIEFRGRTNATPLWVVAIADDIELAQWKTRIANGLCGRS